MIQKKNEEDYLIDSAIELFSRYPIEQVTITDICTNCNTSRRTYYNYFRDKNDIVARCFAVLTRHWYDSHAKEMTMHALLLFMAREVCTYTGFFRHAFSYHGQNNIRHSLVEPLQSLLEDLYRTQHHKEPDRPIKDALRFFIYGMLSYIEKEIASDTVPKAEMAVAFFENAMPAVLKEAYLEFPGISSNYAE